MPMLDSYLFFDGQCADAMRFYERTLGGCMETFMTYAQSPQPNQCAPGEEDRIMHACLVIDGRMLMASDAPAGMHKPMAGFSLSLNYPEPRDAERVFHALAEGGTVSMPLAPTFWAETFGMLTDRFGTPWMVGGGMRGA
jgi:PhnB protein